MATTIDVSGLTKYVDQLSASLVRESVLKGKTVGLINTQVGIKYAEALNIMTSTLNVQAGGCGTISPSGSVALSQRNITVCPIKVEESICLNDLEQYWTGMSMKSGSYGETVPEVINTGYAADKVDKIQRKIEDYIWQGDTSNNYSNGLTLCGGFLSILEYTAATSSVVSSGSTYSGALTAANAISVIDSMVSAIPDAILGNDDLAIFMSYANFRTYINAWRDRASGAGAFHTDATNPRNWEFVHPGTNVTVYAVAGLINRTHIILTNRSNLFFGTDLTNDFENFMVWFERKDDIVYFRSKFKIGTQIAYPQYVVKYK